MKKFKRHDDSKLHLYISLGWPCTTTKNNQPTTPKAYFFAPFKVQLKQFYIYIYILLASP